MACCGGRNTGAIQGLKYGRPLKECFERGRLHPYLDTLGKLIVKEKNVISYPIVVETRDLDRLRKVLQRPSDGLILSQLKVDGELALAAIKDLLEQLPTPLLGRDSTTLATWTRATAVLHVSETAQDVIQDPEEHDSNVKAIKNVVGHLDTSDHTMFRFVVALIRLLSQHPEKSVIRPRHQAELTRFFVESLVYKKAKTAEDEVDSSVSDLEPELRKLEELMTKITSDFQPFGRYCDHAVGDAAPYLSRLGYPPILRKDLEKSERTLNFLVRFADEIFDGPVETLVVPRQEKGKRRSTDSVQWTSDAYSKESETLEHKLRKLDLELDENEVESGVDVTSVGDLSKVSSKDSRRSSASKKKSTKSTTSQKKSRTSKKSLSSVASKSKSRKSKELSIAESKLAPYAKSGDLEDTQRVIASFPMHGGDKMAPIPVDQRSYTISSMPKTEPKMGVSTPETKLTPMSMAILQPQVAMSSPNAHKKQQQQNLASLQSMPKAKLSRESVQKAPVKVSPYDYDPEGSFDKVSIKGLPLGDPRLTENDLWEYLVINMENQIKETRAILNHQLLFPIPSSVAQ